MADPSLFDAIRIPAETLIALDNRSFHFALQPWHYLIRLAHILSMALFFGAIVLIDLHLIGFSTRLPFGSMEVEFSPVVGWSFVIAFVTGLALFFYAPVKVGSHAYFAPKLILTALGMINAALYHRLGQDHSRPGDGRPSQVGLPVRVRIAGLISLLIWTGVVTFAALNVEGVPRVLLR